MITVQVIRGGISLGISLTKVCGKLRASPRGGGGVGGGGGDNVYV